MVFLLTQMCGVVCCGIFFFQAEDGIRDLVRSRGLGDVYKRQVRTHLGVPVAGLVAEVDAGFQHLAHGDLGHGVTPEGGIACHTAALGKAVQRACRIGPVSYTHLTLPTSGLG